MSSKIATSLIICLLMISSIQAEFYAVLITGDTPQGEAAGPKTWQGGQDLPGFDEFWNDTFLMWEMLWQYGWKDENIFVLFGNGQDWQFVNPRYWGNQYYEEWGIEHITDDGAYYQDVVDIFNYLDGVMTDSDELFVWTFDHGNPGANLQLMDQVMWDYEFAAIMPEHYICRVFWMQQCFSGGFIDDLHNDDTVILTACSASQMAGPADNTNPDGGDPLENEWYAPQSDDYDHGEFNYHVLNAARLETVGYFNNLPDPDLDQDGMASVYEVKAWNFLRESKPGETPQYSDDGGIGGNFWLNMPPYPPQNLQLENVNNQCHLTWNANTEYDFNCYQIYRYVVQEPDVPPADPWPCIGSTVDNEFTDPQFVPRPGGPDAAYYKVCALDLRGSSSGYSNTVGSHGIVRPYSEGMNAICEMADGRLHLDNNPDPFNPTTTISFTLPEASQVTLTVYDVQGQVVAQLVNGWREAGSHSAAFHSTNLASGIYVYRLTAGIFNATGKMVLRK